MVVAVDAGTGAAAALDRALAIAAARVELGDVAGACAIVERVADALVDELAERGHPTARAIARLREGRLPPWGPA